MDLEDLLGGDKHRRRNKNRHGYRDHGDHDEHGHRHGEHAERNSNRPHDHHREDERNRSHRNGDDRRGDFDLEHVAERILANKKLLIVAAVVLVVVLVLAAIFLLPLLGQAIDYVDKGGVKGVLDRVWQGSGGGK